jgi:hypothetical protein
MKQSTSSNNLVKKKLPIRRRNSFWLKAKKNMANISGFKEQNATDTSPVASEPLKVTPMKGDFRVFPSFIVTLRQFREL